MSDLFTLHKICEKHGISERQIKMLLRGIEAGLLNSVVLEQTKFVITPMLQELLDDLAEANFICKHELECYAPEK
jgi:hypothetical protein